MMIVYSLREPYLHTHDNWFRSGQLQKTSETLWTFDPNKLREMTNPTFTNPPLSFPSIFPNAQKPLRKHMYRTATTRNCMHRPAMSIHIHTHIHVHIHIHTNIHILYVYIYIYIYIDVYVYVYVYIHLYIYICIDIDIDIDIAIDIYI